MTVDSKAIRDQLKDFIKANFLLGKDQNSLQDSDSFLHTGIVDSTGVLEIVGFIQETFAITVADEDLLPENLDSINNLTTYITRHLTT